MYLIATGVAHIRLLRNYENSLIAYPNRMTVGEVFTLPPGNPEPVGVSYLGSGKDQLNLAFDFP